MNRVKLLPENRVVSAINNIVTAEREFKNRQFGGGDNIVIASTDVQSSSFTLASFGNIHYETVLLQPISHELLISELAFTLYVDVKDSSHIWPGFGTYVDFLNTIVHWQEQTTAADDAVGTKRYLITVMNNDISNSHIYFLDSKIYYPKVATS